MANGDLKGVSSKLNTRFYDYDEEPEEPRRRRKNRDEEPRKPKRERKKRRPFRTFLKVLFLLLLAVIAACVVFVVYTISKAPGIETLDATPKGYRTTVLDDEENVILTLSGAESNRVYVTIDQMPQDLQDAFVVIEDMRFYQHNGIDVRGIFRALVQAVKDRELSQGASTITQQLIKNNVLTGWMEEKTDLDRITRKIQEQYLALMLEQQHDKDWILENYLNTINLGGGTYGVEAAAKYYFAKDVSSLTLSEAAVLAAIPKSPTEFNPLRNPKANAGRRKIVLSYLLEQGKISRAEYDEALADDVYTRIAEAEGQDSNNQVMSYFEDAMLYQIIEDLGEEGYSADDAWNMIYTGGLTIHATVDSKLQEIAENEVNNDENYDSDAQAAVVLIDNETGQIKAMVGGRGTKKASLLFNRATDSIRQPGSTIKVIGQFAAGIETGRFTLGTAFDDAPYAYSNGQAIHNVNGKYRGMMTVREAIRVSNNVVALKCLQSVGIPAAMDFLEDFGITTLTDDDMIEALALGGTTNGVTDLELTGAYAALARGGMYIEPIYYTTVLDLDGNILLEKEQASHRAVSAQTAELLTSAMEDVISTGSAKSVKFDGQALAGKTGTTSDYKDVWMVGYSKYLTCGVWGGYDNYADQESSAFVRNIWKGIMQQAHEDLPNAVFPRDPSLVTAKICTKCGRLAVDGLCDDTVQGDMTRTEYFISGTQPRVECNCHIRVVTSDPNEDGFFAEKQTDVYLISASEGTTDEKYVRPEGSEEYTENWFKNWIREHIFELPWKKNKKDEEEDPGRDYSEDAENDEDAPTWWWMQGDDPTGEDESNGPGPDGDSDGGQSQNSGSDDQGGSNSQNGGTNGNDSAGEADSGSWWNNNDSGSGWWFDSGTDDQTGSGNGGYGDSWWSWLWDEPMDEGA